MLFDGMHGLGDNLYQRAVIRRLTGINYLITPWPQLYSDLPHVKCVRPAVERLRTQARNVLRTDLNWTPAPRESSRKVHYVGRPGSMLQGLCETFGVATREIDFSGPPVEVPKREPYIVVRPASIRSEWRADSRNPRPEYLALAARRLRERYRVISIGDFEVGKEWPVGELPPADERYHAGELKLEDMLGLVAGAAAVVGSVGWLVPAAVAYRVPMMLVHGGWGFHNGPQRIFDRRMETSRIYNVMPDAYCMCKSATHDCDKRISDFEGHINEFMLRLAA